VLKPVRSPVRNPFHILSEICARNIKTPFADIRIISPEDHSFTMTTRAIMNMPVFLIINATSNANESDAKARYQAKSQPIAAKYGAVPVANYSLTESLDEHQAPEVCVIISFPSKESIYQLFADAEYLKIVEDRDLGFSSLRYFIGNERVA